MVDFVIENGTFLVQDPLNTIANTEESGSIWTFPIEVPVEIVSDPYDKHVTINQYKHDA